MEENLSCFLLGRGNKQFTNGTVAEQQRSQLRIVQWAGAIFSAHIPPLLVLVFPRPPPLSQLFYIPFLPSPFICISLKSFKGEPVPSATRSGS